MSFTWFVAKTEASHSLRSIKVLNSEKNYNISLLLDQSKQFLNNIWERKNNKKQEVIRGMLPQTKEHLESLGAKTF